MSEKELRCSRYIENFNPPDLIEKLEHKIYESVTEAFLDQVEYGKDYIIGTELTKEDWADGFGTKYTYSLKFDELVRCRNCRYFRIGTNTDSCGFTDKYARPDGFCAWGERREK